MPMPNLLVVGQIEPYPVASRSSNVDPHDACNLAGLISLLKLNRLLVRIPEGGFLVGGFKYFLFSPQNRGNDPI